MKSTILLALTCLLLSSCATIFNARTDVMKIVSNEPAKIIVKEDTFSRMSTEHYVALIRSKQKVPVAVYNNEKYKYFLVKPRNSVAYWLNFYPLYGAGFLIDMANPRRYSYPRTIYVDMDQPDIDYTTFRPIDSTLIKYDHIVKLNPLKAVGFANAGLEISLEQRTSPRFTTQVSAAYLFPRSPWDTDSAFDEQIKGFQLGIEERYYLGRSAPKGLYVALDFSFLKTNYKDIWRFGKADVFDTINTNYVDTFGVAKQTYTFNCKLGYQFIMKRITIDVYTGLGLRYKEVSHFDRMKPADEMEMPRHPNVYYIKNREGKYWTSVFPLNFRIGYTF